MNVRTKRVSARRSKIQTADSILKNTRLALAVAATLAAVLPASAATLTWDPDGALPLAGGGGIWNTSSALWTADAGASFTTWSNGTPDNAIFNGPIGTVTLGTAITAGTVTLNTAGYTIDLAGFNLAIASTTGAGVHPATTITNTSGTLATLTAATLSAGGPKLSGNMAVLLSGTTGWNPAVAHDFTGTFTFRPTVSAVTLIPAANAGFGSAAGQIALDASLLTGTSTAIINWSSPDNTQLQTYTRNIALTHGATSFANFQVNGGKQITLTGVISGGTVGGSGLRFTSGQGHIILSSANTYQGVTTVSGQNGMLTLAHKDALGASAGALPTDAGVSMTSTLQTLGIQGGITVTNNTPINLGTNGGTTPSSGYGNIHSFSGDNTLSNNILWGNNATKFLGAEAGSTLTLTGVLGTALPSEPAGITKIGYGTVVLTGENKFGTRNAGVTSVVNATVVNEGTLRLDFSPAGGPTSNLINNSGQSITGGQVSALFLGGGKFDVKGAPGETNSQTFKNHTSAGFTINAGASAVTATQNGAASLSINLGQVSGRNQGGTVDFSLPELDTNTDTRKGAIVLSIGTVPTGLVGEIITTNGAAFMTVDGTDWAGRMVGNAIESGSRIAGFYTASSASTLAGNANMSAGVDTALVADANTTSLRFHNSGTRSINVGANILTTGGILLTNTGNGPSAINGGTLRGQDSPSGLLQDLVIVQNNVAGKLAIGSTITNALNTLATGLTKSGPGILELTGANSYTGPTTVTGGILKLEHATAIPGGIDSVGGTANLNLKGGVIGLTVASGDFKRGIGTGATQVQFTGSSGFAAYGGDRIVNLGGASASVTFGSNLAAGTFVLTGSALILGASDSDSTITFQNPISLRSPNAPQQREFRVENGSQAVDARLTGVISGDGGLTKSGEGTLELASVAAGTYVGQTIIEAGTLRIGVAGALPGASTVHSAITVRAGTLDLNGTNYTARNVGLTLGGGAAGTTAAITTGAGILTLATDVVYNGAAANDNGATLSGNLALGAATRAFTVHDSSATANDLTVSAIISGTGGLLKAGDGTLLLAGANTYTGTTTVADGTLAVSGSLTGSVLVSGGVLGGTGTVGATTLDGDGILAPGLSPGILNTGNLALNDGTFAVEIINDSSYDQVNVTGTVSLGGPVALTLSVANPISEGSPFRIVQNDGADTITLGSPLARFVYDGNSLDEGEFFTVTGGFGAQAFQISYAGGTDNNDVVLTAVPEPGAVAMMLGGLACLFGFQRRRAFPRNN